MRNIVYLLLLFCAFGYSQSPSVLASQKQRSVSDGLSETIKGAVIYYDDFENGEAPWNVDGEYEAGGATLASSALVTDASALSGTKVLRLRADDTVVGGYSQVNTFRYDTFDSNDDIVWEFKFKLPQLIDLETGWDSFMNLWQVKGDNVSPYINDPLWVLGIDNRGGKGAGNPNYLKLEYMGQFWPEVGISQFFVTEIGTTNIAVGVWHKVTIRYKRNNGNGIIQVYQNNVLTHSETGAMTYPSDYASRTFESVNNYGEGRTSKTVNGTPTGLGYSDVLVDNVGIYVYDGPVPVDEGVPNELWPSGDATSTNDDEADSVAGWSANSVTITSDNSDPQEGAFSFKAVANAVVHFNTRAYRSVSGLTASTTYVLDFNAKTNNTSYAKVYTTNSVGGDKTVFITSTEWTRYTLEFAPTGTAVQLRALPFESSAQGTIGDAIELDNVRLYVKP